MITMYYTSEEENYRKYEIVCQSDIDHNNHKNPEPKIHQSRALILK